MTASAVTRQSVHIITPSSTLLSDVFSKAIAQLCDVKNTTHIAVAVSGGGDSMALILLAHNWATQHNITLTALTVNHGLRKEATEETAQVNAWLAKYGITHHALTITDPPPETGVQAWARDTRYQLMADWCLHNNAVHLLVAHHEDDNIETYYIRKAAQSGEDGLAGMSAHVERNGIALLRPLLATPKAALIEYLHANNQPWIEDPTNRNMVYTRNAIRASLTDAEKGEARKALVHYVTLRKQREVATNALLAHSVQVTTDGSFIADISDWHIDEAIGKRALQHLAMHVGAHDVPPRSEKLERLWQHLHNASNKYGALRCLWVPQKDNTQWFVSADPKHIKAHIYATENNPLIIPPFYCIKP